MVGMIINNDSKLCRDFWTISKIRNTLHYEHCTWLGLTLWMFVFHTIRDVGTYRPLVKRSILKYGDCVRLWKSHLKKTHNWTRDDACFCHTRAVKYDNVDR